VIFHNLGLWGSDVVNGRNWTLNQLATIRSKLDHEKVTLRLQSVCGPNSIRIYQTYMSDALKLVLSILEMASD